MLNKAYDNIIRLLLSLQAAIIVSSILYINLFIFKLLIGQPLDNTIN